MTPPSPALDETALERRFVRVGAALLATYLVLALTHGGEFWPFSRFPMFSNARKPWLRATMRELSDAELARPLAEVGERDLPGAPFPLTALEVEQNDLSEVIKNMGESLDAEELQLLRRFGARIGQRKVVLYAVRGRLRSDRSVRVRYRPLALLTHDAVSPITPAPPADGRKP
jgi:hypothetical protein